MSVDQHWRVTIGCPALALTGPSRVMRRLPDDRGGSFPLAPLAELPGPEADRPACCDLYCCSEDAAVLAEGRQRIIDRNLAPGIGTSNFGGYLFHALIGAAAWQWVREVARANNARCMELALSWANVDANLNRLNWEMMHDGHGFLAAGLPGMTVAITRLVAGTVGDRWEPRQCEFPPRILFVVGTTLNDPNIRPAAEFLGLMGGLRNSGRRIRARVLENTRTEDLVRVIPVFRPYVVHFICHGDWDRVTGRGYLELAPDDANGDRSRYADQLYAAMTVDALPPPLVILSVCRTGSAVAPPPGVLEGAHDLAPLATELVSLGIPLVLGTAGRVSDTTCQLFTRQFGDALVEGESLVAATAEARRATVSQGRTADESVDWAFPALFAAGQVDPGFASVPPGAADSPTPEENWIRDYDLERDSVFYGRNEFFEAYYGFFAPAPRRVLAIVADEQRGVGRTRLLLELAAQMLQDGNIPVILASDEPGWKPPQSLQAFGVVLGRAIRKVRRALALGSAPGSQLALLLADRSAPGQGQLSLRGDIAEELGPDGELTAVALRLAMQADLRRLVKDARKQHESVRRAEGRAIVLLDLMEQYGELLPEVMYRMLDGAGFGTSDEPVPAVLALAMGQPANAIVKDTLERVASRSWLRQLPLRPFDFKSGDSWILLNPPSAEPAARVAGEEAERFRPAVGDSIVMAGASGSAGPGPRPGWRWDVALSFAGAQRDYVEQVAQALQARGVRCFYDADEQIELWGKYLAEELPAIYAEQAAAVVVFVSAEYAARDWTRLERRAALNRALRERREYVLPARFDDTPLPGLLSDMIAIDLRTRTPQQFAAMIAGKLAALDITVPSADSGGPAQDSAVARPAGAVQAGETDPRRPGVYAAISVPGVPEEVQFAYEDFDLLIEPGAGGSYRARVLRSPAGESAPVQFILPFSPVELENFVLKVGPGRRRTRGPGRPEIAPLKDFGGKLYNAVFQGELRDTLLRSLSQTRVHGAGMRLRLRLTDAPELADVPWEFLYDPYRNRFLAQSRHTPLIRYLELPDPPRPLSVEGPLRLLVMISSPAGYPELDVEQEWNVLAGALAQQQAEGRVIVERLDANMSTLRSRLRRERFHVFHFVGHGFYRSDWDDGVLVMEDRNGRPHEVTGEELGSLLNEYDLTRLAVLNACEGARGGTSNPFAGMAQSLIQQGLPAVVAMQFEITDTAAITFAHELYGAIADGYPLEAALAEARGAIRDEGNATEWATPVLYSRATDGRLFDRSR